jgi:hypothetical protein
MTAAMMSMIMSWCAAVHTVGPVVVNGPNRELQCRETLIKCVDGMSELTNSIPADCLKRSLE